MKEEGYLDIFQEKEPDEQELIKYKVLLLVNLIIHGSFFFIGLFTLSKLYMKAKTTQCYKVNKDEKSASHICFIE